MFVLFSAGAQEILKLTGQKNVLQVQNLTVNPDNSVTYTVDGKKKVAPANTFDYARIPMPKEIAEADRLLKKNEFSKAEKMYQSAFEKYRLLGWGSYCISHRAKALAEAGKEKEALAFLNQLRDYSSMDPEVNKHLLEARKFLVDLLIKSGDLKSAESLLAPMISGKHDSGVCFAFLRKGDIATLQKANRKAVRYYTQAAFLFPEDPCRPEALYKTVILLKELKDPRWENFADILKKQYPSSGFVKKL